MSKEQKNVTYYVQDIPSDLKQRYKAVLARRGETIRDALIQHMEEVVAEGEQEIIKGDKHADRK